jgi:STE24 endopeptidase
MQAVQNYTLPPETLIKAIQFAHARHVLYFAGFAFSILVLLVIIRLRVAPKLRGLRQPVFFASILLIFVAANIPVDMAGHAISLHFGISIQPWLSWLWDWTKEQAVTVVIGALLAWPFYALLRRSPRRWWFWAWVGSLPLLVLGVVAGPLLFEHLFNDFTPLSKSHPDLVSQVERLLQRAGVSIPPDHIFEMSASQKTNALNAYVSGFGPSRRVVLYDTIIRKEDGGPLMTTVGHELGHYVLNHIGRGLVFTSVLLLLGFYLVYIALGASIRKWGDWLQINAASDPASLPLLLLIALLLGFLSEPIVNAYSRRQEHEADLYSLEVTHGVVPDASQAAARAFQIEGETDLDQPDPDPFIVFWLYSHPPTSERLRFALTYDPWRTGRQPQYVRQ